MEVLIAGAIDTERQASSDPVAAAFRHPVAINSESGFVGRPETQLYASDEHVLKVKTEFSLECDAAWHWACKQLEQEREWAIYAPERTWLVLRTDDGCAIANITPRMETLDQVLKTGRRDSTDKVGLLQELVRFYFRFYKTFDLRQDEGLTNYGVRDNRIFYLDDDIYGTDNLIAFAHSLATWLRMMEFLSPTGAYMLGKTVREEADDVGPNQSTTVYKQFNDAFIPPAREPLRKAVNRALTSRSRRTTCPGDARVAILADIHANLGALEAVLADIHEQGLREGVVLGDVVGYGPEPGACVDRLAETGFTVIRGNHDQAASYGSPGKGLSRAAMWSAPWTHSMLSSQQCGWLAGLPLYLQCDDFYAVHGAPIDPTFFNAYVYIMTYEKNLDYMAEKGMQLCFHGHSHVTGCWHRDAKGDAAFISEGTVDLEEGHQYLVCPGSVGQPRDESTGARYMIFDRENHRLEFREVSYDRDELRRKMVELSFPDYVLRLFGLS